MDITLVKFLNAETVFCMFELNAKETEAEIPLLNSEIEERAVVIDWESDLKNEVNFVADRFSVIDKAKDLNNVDILVMFILIVMKLEIDLKAEMEF